MSESNRVTIGDITEDLLPFTEKGNKVITIEIVPRKIVEDIIEECKERKRLEEEKLNYVDNSNVRNLYYTKAATFENIAIFAERLLNEFEEGGKG